MSGSWKSSLLVGIVAMIFVAVLTVQVQRVTNQVSEAGLQVSAADQKLLIQNLVAERLDKLKAIYPFSSLMTETEAPEQFRLLAQLAVDPQGDVVVRRLRRSPQWELGREETASLLSLLRQRDYQHGKTYLFLRRSESEADYYLMAFLGDDANASDDAFESQQRTLWMAVFTENPLHSVGESVAELSGEVSLVDSLGQDLLGKETLLSAAHEIPRTNLQLHYRPPSSLFAGGRAPITAFALRIGLGLLLAWGALLYFFRRHFKIASSSAAAASPPEHVQTENFEGAPELADSEPVGEEDGLQTTEAPEESSDELPVAALPPQLEDFADSLYEKAWALLGPLQTLKSKGLVPEHHRLLLDMETQLRPLLVVGESLRAYYQKEHYPMETLDLSRLVKELCESWSDRCLEEGITLVEQIEEECFVKASSFALRKALGQVFDNSLNAMEETDNKILEVSVSRLDGMIRLRVADSGKGLSAEMKDRAFEPFQGQQPGRMGLGLSYVWGVFQQMGSEILFDTEPNAGAQLLVTLPAAEMVPQVPDPSNEEGWAVTPLMEPGQVEAQDGDQDEEEAEVDNWAMMPPEPEQVETQDEEEPEAEDWAMTPEPEPEAPSTSTIRVRAPKRNLDL